MLISNKPSLLALCSVALLILATGCSDEATGADNCPSGEDYDPVAGECIPVQCPDGATYNPVQGQCESDDTGEPVDPVSPSNDGNGNAENNGNGENGDPNTNANTGENDPQSNANSTPNNSNSTPGNPGGQVEPPYEPYEPQDPTSADYHSCESEDFEGIDEPTFVHHGAANYLLAAAPDVDASVLDASATSLQAHVLEDGDANYAGFILSLSPPDNQNTATESADWIFDQIAASSGYDATRQGDGYSFLTHDNFSASILNHVSLSTGDSPAAVRDQVIGSILGIATDDLEHSLSDTTAADGSGAHLVYKTVARTEEDVIVVGAVSTTDLHDQHDSDARFAIQDLAGGTALAASGETMSDECVSLEIRDTNEVDIIVSLDASGSMSDVNDGLINFADELADLLNATGVDWRVAVTGVDCNEIREDDGLSAEFRALWPDPDEWEGDEPPINFPGFDDINAPCTDPASDLFPSGGDDNNGRLMGDFTTDPAEIQNQMSQVSGTGLEYTLTMGLAALDHSLPRAENAGDKLRTHAAPVVIVVTDENEQLFKDAHQSFISGGNDPLSASETSELLEFIQPWMDFINRPDLGATISGLYWVPGTDCAGGIDVGHGIHHFVEQTGGVYDSICEPEIGQAFGEIAEATQDLVTGLHLVGRPVAHSVSVDVEDLITDAISPLDRSITDGFDFDSTSNSLHFEGPSAPEEDQRVVVPYLSWDGTVVPCSDENQCPGGGKCVKGTCQ